MAVQSGNVALVLGTTGQLLLLDDLQYNLLNPIILVM